MNYWILPSNEKVFRLTDYLKQDSVVDWKQTKNFEEGDIVFIYTSYPSHRITEQFYVDEVDVESSRYHNNKMFWDDLEEYQKGLEKNRFVRLRHIVSAPPNSRLTFDDLRAKGLTANLQGATIVTDKPLLDYIKRQILPDSNEKIARICWNTNGWERPSGRDDKSKSQDTYEAEAGFGHEEWLLDRRTIMPDGYHYGYLEPLRKSSFEGKKDIHLYTFRKDNGKRQYIGVIRDAEYVPLDEAVRIWKIYEERGWAESMRKELLDCGIDPGKDFMVHANVRFRFKNFIDYSDKEIYISIDDTNTMNTHYVFLNKRVPFRFETPEDASLNDDNIINDLYGEIPEGAKSRVVVNRYERSQTARKECLEAHGISCSVCGMNFEKVYGELGKGFIHVHHIVPISEVGEAYVVDPKNDLVPVCPNCHAMLHHGRDGKVLSIAELKEIIKKNSL